MSPVLNLPPLPLLSKGQGSGGARPEREPEERPFLPSIALSVDARRSPVSNHINPGSVQPHLQSYARPIIDQTMKVTRGSGPGPVVNSDGQRQFVNSRPGQQGVKVERISNSQGDSSGEIQSPRLAVPWGKSEGSPLGLPVTSSPDSQNFSVYAVGEGQGGGGPQGLAVDAHPAGQGFNTFDLSKASVTTPAIDVQVISNQTRNLKPATVLIR